MNFARVVRGWDNVAHGRTLAMAVLLLVLVPLVSAASFTNSPQLYFTGTSSSPSTLYQDAIGPNQDVGIELCGQGPGRYVGGFYAANIAGTWNYALITYSSSSNALAQANTNAGGGCYDSVPGFLTVSPSSLSTPSPNVDKAALPGELYVGHASTANPGTVSNFVFGGTSMQLRGDYTIQRSFDQGTLQITAQDPTVSFTTSSGSFSKSATDPTFGVASDRPLIMAVCSDTQGQSCSDGGVITSNIFPYSMSTGLSAGSVNDQRTYTRYIVANGLGKSICIGANLKASIINIAPNPVYYSQNLSINFSTTNKRDTPFEINGGNVGVTTPFQVRVEIYNSTNPSQVVYNQTQTISNAITPDGTIQLNLLWPAYAHSGTYTVKVTTDVNNNIVECNEGDNTATQNFVLKPITLPDVYIDGVKTSTFPYPNAPYNLSFHMKNSDNTTLANATVYMTQTNGLSMLAPTQIYNRSVGPNATVKDGVRTNETAVFTTDAGGNASLVFIPTYNDLYLARYNYTDLSSYIGNYSLSMSGVQQDNQSFKFVIGGKLTNDYPFDIANVSFTGPYPLKTIRRKAMVSQVLDFVYHSYAAFLQSVLGS